MDLRIVTDTADRLVVQTTPDQTPLYVMACVVFGVIAFAATRLWRRSRGFAVAILFVVGVLFCWTVASLLRTGGVVDEFSIDRTANTFVVDSFFPHNHQDADKPVVRPLDQVSSATIEQTRHGSTLVVTLRSGDKAYPLGHVARRRSNEDAVLQRVKAMLNQSRS